MPSESAEVPSPLNELSQKASRTGDRGPYTRHSQAPKELNCREGTAALRLPPDLRIGAATVHVAPTKLGRWAAKAYDRYIKSAWPNESTGIKRKNSFGQVRTMMPFTLPPSTR